MQYKKQKYLIEAYMSDGRKISVINETDTVLHGGLSATGLPVFSAETIIIKKFDDTKPSINNATLTSQTNTETHVKTP